MNRKLKRGQDGMGGQTRRSIEVKTRGMKISTQNEKVDTYACHFHIPHMSNLIANVKYSYNMLTKDGHSTNSQSSAIAL